MDNKSIGKFISERRILKGLTQRELGEKLFVTGKAVSKWERGLSLPDISLLEKLALELDTDIYSILQIEKKENVDLESIINEERAKVKRQFKIKLVLLSGLVIFVFCVILFKVVPFGYNVEHPLYYHNTKKYLSLGVPKFSFNYKNNEDSFSYSNLRGKKVLTNEVKYFLNSMEHLSCYDTVYYYDSDSDVTIVDYSVNGKFVYSTISYSVRNGNYCEKLKVNEYVDKLGGFDNNYKLYTEEDTNFFVNLTLYINEDSDDKFYASLFVGYKKSENSGIRIEQSNGIFEIKDDELIYKREDIIYKNSSLDVPLESSFVLRNNKLILKDNYLKSYFSGITLSKEWK